MVKTPTPVLAAAALACALALSAPPTATAHAAPSPSPAVPSTARPTPADHGQDLADAAAGSAAIARSLGLGSAEQLVVKDAFRDANGTRHFRYERTYGGLPVLGGDLIVHRAADGTVKGVNRASEASLNGLSTTPKLAAVQAQAAALAAEPGTTVQAAPRLVVWAASGTPKLAWETVVTGKEADGTPRETHVVTDANSGEVLRTFEGIHKGTGTGVFVGNVAIGTSLSGATYQMKDPARGGMYTTSMNNGTSGNGTLFTKTADTWGDGTAVNKESAAVDAHYGAGATWDFYKNTYGRNGIRNDGVGAFSRVHYGSNYVNAFWSDACFCMTYGDGASNTHPLTALDVAGHEMTHGVTSNTAGLIYSGESGGLNESTSDVFGSMVEWYANLPADVPDYLIGELININGNGTPLRYMDKPSKDTRSADSWYSGVGSLDVHYSSGVGNHAFYLLAEGSGTKVINGVTYNSPTVNSITVTGIGRDRAAAIWYRALTTYWTSTTNYASARAGMLSAATDLYGAGSAEYNATATAWAAVNVGTLPSTVPVVTNPGNRTTKVNTPVSLQIQASGGTGALTYAAAGLPAGLSINPTTGLITGTPTAVGTSTATVTARDTAGRTGSTTFTWTITTATACTPAQLLGNPGFETGSPAPWTATPSVIQGSSARPARTGTWYAWLNGYGTTHTDTLAQTATIPTGCRATLTFWLRIDTAETTTSFVYDKLTVQANTTTLASFSNLNKTTGYVQKTYDLTPYAGQTINLKFTGTEDFSLQTSFVVDDATLSTS
ncbi:M4 family metallopeptidase [Streptomyces wedmorensis]